VRVVVVVQLQLPLKIIPALMVHKILPK